MTSVVYLIEWLNGAKCYAVLGAVMKTTVLMNAKRLRGQYTRSSVRAMWESRKQP